MPYSYLKQLHFIYQCMYCVNLNAAFSSAVLIKTGLNQLKTLVKLHKKDEKKHSILLPVCQRHTKEDVSEERIFCCI